MFLLFTPIDTTFNIRTVIAILIAIEPFPHPACDSPFLLIEPAARAFLGEVRVRLVEDLPRLGRVATESALRLLVVGIVGDVGGWFVGGFERALAVPAVARSVLVPERVVDGARHLLFPKPLVFGFGVGRCGGHPAQVRHDVAVALELQPVRRCSALNE